MVEVTYSESAHGVPITKARARLEIERHGLGDEFDRFLAEVGDRETYDARLIFDWLGY